MNNIHLFAGANSAQGFCSHYQYLALDSFQRVYILKGGPGTGKSTIIKEVAKQFPCSLEKYHCTAAADSLDGLYIPSKQVSILDGTAPHTIGPRLPGAVQQTVDLGSYWDYRALAARRQQIEKLINEISELYKIAYGWLAVAAGLANLVQKTERRGDVEAQAQDDMQSILKLVPDTSQGFNRKAFASGLTSKGIVNFLPRLKAKSSIALEGGNRAFNSLVLAEIARALKLRGIPAIYLYCGFQPDYLEHIYIPGEFALFSSHPPHRVQGADWTFGSDYRGPSESADQIQYYMDKAVINIAAAAKLHAALEGCYNPCMNFQEVAGLPKRIAAEIAYLNP